MRIEVVPALDLAVARRARQTGVDVKPHRQCAESIAPVESAPGPCTARHRRLLVVDLYRHALDAPKRLIMNIMPGCHGPRNNPSWGRLIFATLFIYRGVGDVAL